jgi:hypothetical protein
MKSAIDRGRKARRYFGAVVELALTGVACQRAVRGKGIVHENTSLRDSVHTA